MPAAGSPSPLVQAFAAHAPAVGTPERPTLSQGLNASEAAFRVGYASASQFSRDFKTLFGDSPSQAVAELRHRLAPTGEHLQAS